MRGIEIDIADEAVTTNARLYRAGTFSSIEGRKQGFAEIASTELEALLDSS
ncbi:MAG: hypothetical protein N2235_16505 [Fischerella sp.]|nr:hypothetical protein [Fischerella sp.]